MQIIKLKIAQIIWRYAPAPDSQICLYRLKTDSKTHDEQHATTYVNEQTEAPKTRKRAWEARRRKGEERAKEGNQPACSVRSFRLFGFWGSSTSNLTSGYGLQVVADETLYRR